MKTNTRIVFVITVACTLLFSSGCTNSVSIKSKDTNPFILELDKAGLNFQSGNQLACIYQYKYLDLTMGQLDGKNYLDDLVDGVPLPQFIEEGIAEAKRRVAENADTNLRDAISRDSSNWTDVCSVYGEMDPNTGWWNPNVPEIDATQEFQTGDESIDAGSFVWQRNLDMTGVGTWAERPREDWKEDVGQQYLFVNKVNCLFYVFDENSKDRDLMQRAYQWLSQYSGVHIAGPTWILMDSSYGEKCTGPVTDALGGYRLN